MKRLLLLVFFCAQIEATELSCNNINSIINDKIINMIEKRYADVDFYDLSVQTLGTKFPSDCDYISFKFPQKVDLNGDLVIKFDAFKNNEFQKRATKIFRLSGWATIIKTAQISHRGDLVTSKNTYKEKIKLNQVSIHTISKIKDENVQFRNYVDKNQIIEAWMVEKKPDVIKGDFVKAVVKKSTITLTLDARILQNGYIGEKVKLKLTKNNKVLLGKLHDKKTVIISSL